MLEFSDWKYSKPTGNVMIWSKKLQNINGIFELSINHYLDYGRCTLYVTYNSNIVRDTFVSFSRAKFKEDELYCFDDIETAKTYVENFETFLNRCLKLSAFL
jgi:hypothetical protein